MSAAQTMQGHGGNVACQQIVRLPAKFPTFLKEKKQKHQ